MVPVTLQDWLAASGEALGCRLLAEAPSLSRALHRPRVEHPGLGLVGYPENYDGEWIYLLGTGELTYLRGVSQEQCSAAVANVCRENVVALIIPRNLDFPPPVIEAAAGHGVAVVAAEANEDELLVALTRFLDERLTPSMSLHGVLMDVLGVGVLILGPSGIGKSECALDLILRGHRLVADDIVEITVRQSNQIAGRCSEVIGHHMEIRGLGILNILELFGASAVRRAKRIELVIELAEWDASTEYDRLGVDDQTYPIMGIEIPYLLIPVRPGRNIATIVEIAARNQLLKQQGQHSGREFQERLRHEISLRRPYRHGPAEEIE